MSSKVKVLRSTVAGKRPTGKEFGELWVNDKDKVMGYIDSAGQPVVPFALPSDIVIHKFDATVAYRPGDVVLGPDGELWSAKAAVVAGAWDATKWNHSGDSRFVNLTGDTMTGALNLPTGVPTGNNAVSRTEGDKLYVNLTGDTMTGALTLSGAPTADLHAATKKYADDTFVNVSGDTMTGALHLPADGLTVGTTQIVAKGGNVGIGTPSPAYTLSIQNANGGALEFEPGYAAGGTRNLIQSYNRKTSAYITAVHHAEDHLFLGTAAALTRMVIKADGKVGIATNAPGCNLQVGDGTSAQQEIRTSTNNAAGSGGFIRGYRGGAPSYLIGDLAQISGAATGGLIAYAYGAWPVVVSTNGAERLRVDDAGHLLVGYITSQGAHALQVNGTIFSTSSTIATSDARYKENVQSITGAINIVNALRPVSFDWKDHPVHNFDRSTTTVGFLAQEVEQVIADKPYLQSIVRTNTCTIEPEETDADGNVTKAAVTEDFKGIAEGNLIAILTAAVKEQQALITDLQTRLAALESRP